MSNVKHVLYAVEHSPVEVGDAPEEVIDRVEVFVRGPNAFPNNGWFGDEEKNVGRVYLRRFAKHAGLKGYWLDVASGGVREKYRNKGYFTSFMNDVQRLVRGTAMQGIYVENVMEPFLLECLVERGYTIINETCAYLVVNPQA